MQYFVETGKQALPLRHRRHHCFININPHHPQKQSTTRENDVVAVRINNDDERTGTRERLLTCLPACSGILCHEELDSSGE